MPGALRPGNLAAALARRLGVAYAGDDTVAVSEAGDAAEGALPVPGIVPQPAFLGRPAGDPDGELVADARRLAPGRLAGRVGDDRSHAIRDGGGRRRPRRPERVGQGWPGS